VNRYTGRTKYLSIGAETPAAENGISAIYAPGAAVTGPPPDLSFPPRDCTLSSSAARSMVNRMSSLIEQIFGQLLAVHQWLYEQSDGRIGASLGGRPMLLLRTVGRRTRQPRTAALLYVRDGDAYVVVASKGGAPRHPGWFHNLTARPNVEIQVGRERIPVRARVAAGKERSRLWKRADEVNQGLYTTYQSRTKRVIPVVVLDPR
jgi:deazaflavin-dependent oxidoreductase (nitroreductase family)